MKSCDGRSRQQVGVVGYQPGRIHTPGMSCQHAGFQPRFALFQAERERDFAGGIVKQVGNVHSGFARQGRQQFRLMLGGQRIEQFGQVAIHHGIDLV